MASMTIADAIALAGGRQDEVPRRHRRRRITSGRGDAGRLTLVSLGLALLLASPASGQTASKDGISWDGAVGVYAAGDRRAAATMLVQASASDVSRSAARAHDAWRIPAGTGPDAEARMAVIRRLQMSALMPMDVLLTGSPLPADKTEALVDASRDAWRRLAAFDDERGGRHAASVRRFRVWWRLAVVQQLLTSGRFDIKREAETWRPSDADTDAGATLALLRGIALETRARLAVEPAAGSAGVVMRRLPQPSRVATMNLAMDEAAQIYRRALELAPGDEEISLRLARVALERNRLDEAESLLTPLMRTTCTDAICGLAYLFMGEVHEARQQPDRASSAYARASSIAAIRPPALMAMIQLALRRGNPVAAYELTRQFATPAALTAQQPLDAWNLYLVGYLMEGDRILRRLNEAVVP